MKGIYAFQPAGSMQRAVKAIETGPFPEIAGYDLVVPWRTLQPSKGAFDLSVLDNALTAVPSGQLVTIAVIPGMYAPPWLIAECPNVTVSTYVQHSTVTIAVPTSAPFLAALDALIAELGNHYAKSPIVDSVQTTGCGIQGEMTLPPPLLSTWADHGVDQATLTAAWQHVITAWHNAFPHQTRNLAIEEPLGPHLPILQGLIAWVRTTYPHMELQQNGLKATTGEQPGSYWDTLRRASAWTAVGWQMFGYGPANGDLETAFSIGLAAAASYFQVYTQDIIDPSKTAALDFLLGHVGQ